MYSATLLSIRILALGFFLCLPALAHAESIRSFDADIALAPDGSFSVTETIVYDFEDAERHGIFRTLPLAHPEPASAWYKSRYVGIDIASVSLDGAPAPYITDTPGDTYEVRIGDPDRWVSGVHTYTIEYTARGALFFGSGTPELYWNVTGDGWAVPIEVATVLVTAPAGMLDSAHTCYRGVSGSTEICAATSTPEGVIVSVEMLAPGEGVTIAQALVPESVEPQVLERTAHLLFALSAGVALVGLLITLAYRIYTRHKVTRSVIAEYEPYAGVRPMYAGALIDGTLDARDITAGIVYLAEQGFLTIRKTEKSFLGFDTSDYELTLTRDAAEVPSTFLAQVLSLLFGSEAEVGTVVALSDIKRNLPKQRLNQKILQKLKGVLAADMREEGYFEYSFAGNSEVRRYVLVALSAVLVSVALAFLSLVYLLLAGVVGIVALVLTAIVWTRRTEKGYEARRHLPGFREFLSVTDRDRFVFHNAPEKNPETFLAYLPYAIAFGVEEEWAKVFKDITVPTPEWYHGSGAFTAAAFTHDLHTFTGALESAGTSASSGGGASGGGAGGGGGGSW